MQLIGFLIMGAIVLVAIVHMVKREPIRTT